MLDAGSTERPAAGDGLVVEHSDDYGPAGADEYLLEVDGLLGDLHLRNVNIGKNVQVVVASILDSYGHSLFEISDLFVLFGPESDLNSLYVIMTIEGQLEDLTLGEGDNGAFGLLILKVDIGWELGDILNLKDSGDCLTSHDYAKVNSILPE